MKGTEMNNYYQRGRDLEHLETIYCFLKNLGSNFTRQIFALCFRSYQFSQFFSKPQKLRSLERLKTSKNKISSHLRSAGFVV